MARLLAARLGYTAVDSGAMYRAVALLALEAGSDPGDAPALGRLAASAEMRFEEGSTGTCFLLGGRDVTEAIRSPEVTKAASQVSAHRQVREKLVEQQRALGRRGGLVMEGRDIGTKVFPEADVKIFLDASPEVRGQRRFREQNAAGEASSEEVLREMAERDQRDQLREQSPLVSAEDSERIDSTDLSAEEVVEKILELVQRKTAAADSAGR